MYSIGGVGTMHLKEKTPLISEILGDIIQPALITRNLTGTLLEKNFGIVDVSFHKVITFRTCRITKLQKNKMQKFM